jgi:hypothetical protein
MPPPLLAGGLWGWGVLSVLLSVGRARRPMRVWLGGWPGRGPWRRRSHRDPRQADIWGHGRRLRRAEEAGEAHDEREHDARPGRQAGHVLPANALEDAHRGIQARGLAGRPSPAANAGRPL